MLFLEKKKNILIINGSHHSIIGGTENYTDKLIKIFTNLENNVFELNINCKKFDSVLKNYENINHKIKSINRKSMNFLLFCFLYVINSLKFNLLVHKVLKEKKIDVVIDNTQYTSYKFFNSRKKKFIWVVHSDICKIYKEQKSFWNKIKMFITLRSNRFYFNKIVVYSEKDKEWLLKNNKKIKAENILICPLAHKSYEEINNLNIQDKVEKAKNIIWMGRLYQKEKNINFLTKIAQKLINSNIYIYMEKVLTKILFLINQE